MILGLLGSSCTFLSKHLMEKFLSFEFKCIEGNLAHPYRDLILALLEH